MGASPLATGLSQQAAEPEVSALRASIPSAAHYDTYVFCSQTDEASRALFAELKDRFPFAVKSAPTRMSAWSSGDAMSVSEAMRMALECDALDDRWERVDLALEMEASGTWQGCMDKAAEWGLVLKDNEFVDAPEDASAIEARSVETGTGSVEDDSAVGNAETPNPRHPSGDSHA